MKGQERQIIANVYNTLLEAIKLSPLLIGEFEAIGHIGSSDTDYILAKPQGHTQVYAFIEILKTRDAFSDLYKVLKKHKQCDAAEAILKETGKRSKELLQTLVSKDYSESSGPSQLESTGAKPETPKVSEPKPETPKVSESKPETPKVSESEPERPKVSELKPETPKVSELKPETPKVSEAKPERPKVSELKPETPKVFESKPGTPKVSESKPETPKVSESKPETPKVSEPKPKHEEGKPNCPRKNVYNLPSTGKGLILAINIMKFDNPLLNRYSAIHDTNNVKTHIPALGFTPYPENFDTTQYFAEKDIWNLIEDFRVKCKETNAKAAIMFIGSHGIDDGHICTSDMKSMSINTIISKFYHDKFEYMKDRPKIFAVQATSFTRNFKDANMIFNDLKFQADADRMHINELKILEKDISGSIMADTIIIKSRVPGFPSFWEIQFGSHLVHCITEVFTENLKTGGNLTVREMLEEVVRRVETYSTLGQKPEIKMIKFKDYTL